MFSKWGPWLNKWFCSALLPWLCNPVWIHLSLCFLLDLFDSTIQQLLPPHLTHLFAGNFFLSFLCLSTLSPLSARASLFSNLLCQSRPYTPVFFLNPVSSSHLFSSFIVPPQLLSVLLSLFILTSLRKGAGGEINYHCITQGYIWRHDATDVSGNILVPFLVVYFLMSRAALAASLIRAVRQSSDVAFGPPRRCETVKWQPKSQVAGKFCKDIDTNRSWNLSEHFAFPPVKHVLTHITTAGFYFCWCPVTKLERGHLTGACLSPQMLPGLAFEEQCFIQAIQKTSVHRIIHPSLRRLGLHSGNRRWSNWKIAQTQCKCPHYSLY